MAHCFFLLTKGIQHYSYKMLTYIIRFCKRHHLWVEGFVINNNGVVSRSVPEYISVPGEIKLIDES